MPDLTIAPVDRCALASFVLRCVLCLGAIGVLMVQSQKDIHAQHTPLPIQQAAR